MKIARTRNATRNMIFGIVLKLYQTILPFAMRTVMVYALGVEYLGLNSLFTSILQVLNLAELGVDSAMVFSMYKPIVDEDNDQICALMNLYRLYYRIIGAAILVIGLAICPFIPKLITGNVPSDINVYVLYILNLLATVFTYWLFAYRNSILQAYQRADVVSKVTIVTDTVKYFFQICALCLIKNYYWYVIAILFTQILANIVTAIFSKKLYPQYKPSGKLPKEEIKAINRKIKDLFTAKLGGTIVNSADTIVISAFLGLKVLAIYQNYYYIMTSVMGFITILLSSCTAGIGNSILTESNEKNYRDFETFAFMEIWVAGMCVCCFLNLYQPFMYLWMGEDNMLTFGCIVLMCVYFYLYVTNRYMCIYKDAAGIWHEDRFRPLISAGVNLIINLILVQFIGILGIILSTVISYILITIPWLMHNVMHTIFKRPVWPFLRNCLFYTGAIAIASACTFFLCQNLADNSLAFLGLRLLISVVISNLILFVLLRKSPQFLDAMDIFDRVTKNRIHKITDLMRKGLQ